ncbi:hypothetical protein F4801DRAFT_215051 [Xylaria longipes]|nr:hypothetical protein F4801DRAFT_215051 [Xylaria longipes]
MASILSTSSSSDKGHQQGKRCSSKKHDHDHSHNGDSALTLPQDTDEDTDEDEDGSPEVINQAYKAIWNNFCGLPPNNDVLVFRIGYQSAYKKLYHKLAKNPELLAYYNDYLRQD